ncbi:MAG TPA: hypothetical protein VFK02_27665 [Kofleriaceae bacterium]|nr:hypothetical protein [Kofleriaceae bacterium]
MIRALLAAAIGLGICSGLGCGSGSASPPPAGPAPSGEIADSCTSADDCTLVDACCGCNAGGKQLAIRKDAVAAFQASREQRCGSVMCAQMISTDPSCDAEAICGSRNRCRVAPHMQHAQGLDRGDGAQLLPDHR